MSIFDISKHPTLLREARLPKSSGNLAGHNTREWFQPRKTVYGEKVKAPMVDFW